MDSKTPKYLLFKKVYSLKNGGYGVLFQSQKELANSIVDLEIGYKDSRSLTSFLSRVLRPAGSNFSSKSIPDKLLEGIIQSSIKIISPIEVSNFIKVLKQSFYERPSTDFQDTLSPIAVWNRCLNFMKKEEATIYVFTHNTDLFQWKSRSFSYAFMETIYTIMMEYIRNSALIKENVSRKGFIKICFPSAKISLEFWELFFLFLKQEKGLDHEIAIQQIIKANETFISIIQLEPIDCVPSMIYINNLQELDGQVYGDLLFSISLDLNPETIGAIIYSSSVVDIWWPKAMSLDKKETIQLKFDSIQKFM